VTRIGVTLQGVDDPASFGELARWIEGLGYDDLWLTDSSLHAGEVYVYAALALSATTRLRVGTAVTNPMTRHPAITANAAGTLARLAPGRFACGIGVGDSPLPEIGVKLAKVDTLTETVSLMRRLWAGETLDGRVGRWDFVQARMHAPPGEIPVYWSASGPRTLEAAGEHADGVILLAGLFPEGIAFAREAIERGRARSGRTKFTTTAFLYGSIREDEQVALDEARTIVAWFPQMAPEYARMAGMSDELIAAVRARYGGGEFQRAGAAAALIDDDLVRKVAFAGTRETTSAKLGWLRREGFDAVSVFPLGRDRMATIEAFAAMAHAGSPDHLTPTRSNAA
jgi:5,10-methylenetetrahydromethanopterin reductase